MVRQQRISFHTNDRMTADATPLGKEGTARRRGTTALHLWAYTRANLNPIPQTLKVLMRGIVDLQHDCGSSETRLKLQRAWAVRAKARKAADSLRLNYVPEFLIF